MTSDYDAVGGAPAVKIVVDDFYQRIMDDPLLAPYFDGVDLPNLKRHQAAMVSEVMGGPKGYEGRELEVAHRDLGVTDEAFAAVAGHLQASLEQAGVPEEIIGRTMTAVGSAHGDIVTA